MNKTTEKIKEGCNDKIGILISYLFIFTIIVILFPYFLIFIIFLFFYLNINLSKFLRKLGFYKCLENYKKIKIERKKEIEKNIEDIYYTFFKEDKKEIKKENLWNNIKTKKDNYKETKINFSKNFSFDNRKSIWDDYESVLDKFEK